MMFSNQLQGQRWFQFRGGLTTAGTQQTIIWRQRWRWHITEIIKQLFVARISERRYATRHKIEIGKVTL